MQPTTRQVGPLTLYLLSLLPGVLVLDTTLISDPVNGVRSVWQSGLGAFSSLSLTGVQATVQAIASLVLIDLVARGAAHRKWPRDRRRRERFSALAFYGLAWAALGASLFSLGFLHPGLEPYGFLVMCLGVAPAAILISGQLRGRRFMRRAAARRAWPWPIGSYLCLAVIEMSALLLGSGIATLTDEYSREWRDEALLEDLYQVADSCRKYEPEKVKFVLRNFSDRRKVLEEFSPLRVRKVQKLPEASARVDQAGQADPTDSVQASRYLIGAGESVSVDAETDSTVPLGSCEVLFKGRVLPVAR